MCVSGGKSILIATATTVFLLWFGFLNGLLPEHILCVKNQVNDPPSSPREALGLGMIIIPILQMR